MTNEHTFFFAGGGTGGHIYPSLAIAEKLSQFVSKENIQFFCSQRPLDSQILSGTDFKYTALPVRGFSVRPKEFISFFTSLFAGKKIAGKIMSDSAKPIVIAMGGFVAVPVCLAAKKLKVPIILVNTDSVAGKANRVLARWVDEVFVQFEDTAEYFRKRKIKTTVVGCPLRSSFDNPKPMEVIEGLSLDKNKKILLITGASSGSQNINEAICSLIGKLDEFADSWQIVHITGKKNYDDVAGRYVNAKIKVKVLDYFDNMAGLLSAAELVIGRSGAISVAEYAACGVPSICMPYPYHRDKHQYLNAGKLVTAGAAVIVDDVADATDRAEWLWEELENLMKNDVLRAEMRGGCGKVGGKDAAMKIVRQILDIYAK